MPSFKRGLASVALVDALGYELRFLLPGYAYDMKSAAPLIRGVSFDALLSDKAFVADWLLHDLDQSDILSANPLNANNKIMTRGSENGDIC